MTRLSKLLTLFLLLALPGLSQAFCGFYVAKADSKLFNKASQVVMVRDEDRTVLTMSNDFKGDLDEFAVVIPVPTFLEREQIHVTDRAIVDHLDAYTAPRLVEYFDDNPCMQRRMFKSMAMAEMAMAPPSPQAMADDLGVKIEASYTVGEYDILILSAEESSGLITWLEGNDYRIPDGAESVVNSYIKQGMRFFVAKVNINEQAKLGYNYLRPIQVAYESSKYMLPIRLGMANAKDKQELFVYALTRKGRVETTNYRTVKIASGQEIPVFVKDYFSDFYKDMFSRQTQREDNRAVFLEYAWNMNWCDPCAADPLSNKELRELGVFWLDEPAGDVRPIQPMPRARIMPPVQAKDLYVTRLHVRYDKAHFPEDLFFQTTGDRKNFQGRYVLRHPWKGEEQCEASNNYRDKILPDRLRKEAKTLANLTGWDINEIHQRIPQSTGMHVEVEKPGKNPWWKKIWKEDPS